MIFTSPPYIVRKFFRTVVWDIPSKENVIYLSFDDGPIPVVTEWVLDTLKTYNAQATFFCIGENVKKYPEIFSRITECGHVVGNHTLNHLNGWKTNTEYYFKNVEDCKALVNSNLFRPPYGKIKLPQFKLIRDNYKIIMWSILARDYDSTVSKEKCFSNIVRSAKKGSIIVFHDSVKASDKLYYLLPKVLKHFSEKGFKFKPISV